MTRRLHLPEPGLSRTGRWCLGGSFLLILGFFFVAGIWMPVWRIAEITGTNPRIDPPLSATAEGYSCEDDRVRSWSPQPQVRFERALASIEPCT